MSPSGDLIDFDIIETQKENIQALPSGRSARALASIFSPTTSAPTLSDTKNINDAVRQEYEQELLTIDEADDPLDIYNRYVKWTLNAYPSAQATPESQLLPLLERATKAFLNSPIYKNDPRYLRLWLHYIRLFSDSPRETFIFLARHNIGESLALFYEEFAALLESAGRWTQAEEVYTLGIERGAKPVERLMRKFIEFQKRFEDRPQDDDEPLSPALPLVRKALAAKVDPFSTASPAPTRTDPQATQQPASTSKKSGKQKMTIFTDTSNDGPASKSGILGSAKGWESIGTIQQRKKENTMEAKPWAGETLKVAKKNTGVQKMMVFKDQSNIMTSSNNLEQCSITTTPFQVTKNPRNGRLEGHFVNLELVYPNLDDLTREYSFEELRAKHRGWLDIDWSAEYERQEREKEREKENTPPQILEEPVPDNVDTGDLLQFEEPTELVQNVENGNESGSEKENNMLKIPKSDLPQEHSGGKKSKRPKKYKIKEVRGETQTIKINLDSPTGKKLKRKNPNEPTMTFHTRVATDAIYDIFNQPLKSQRKHNNDEESAEETEYDEDDYTSAGESTATGRMSCPSEAASEIGADDTEIKSTVGDDVATENLTEWSDFSPSKLPKFDQTGGIDRENLEPTQAEEDLHREAAPAPDESHAEPAAASSLHERFVPVPPEDYDPPVGPYPFGHSQSQLPYMTPIVERTETSLTATARTDRGYIDTKTPSHIYADATFTIPEVDDELLESFEEITKHSFAARTKPETVEGQLKQQESPSLGKSKGFLSSLQSMLRGPIVKDTQCNPVDEGIRKTILDGLRPPLSTYQGFFDHSSETSGRENEIKRYIRNPQNKSREKSDRTSGSSTPPILKLKGAAHDYVVRRELGKGAFAPVYLVEDAASLEESAEADGETNGQDKKLVQLTGYSAGQRRRLEAIKCESPPTPWEFYMMSIIYTRLSSSTQTRSLDSLLRAYEMHLFSDEGFLVEEYRDQGTLLDLINIAKSESGGQMGMDEPLAMFFAVELLRTVEALHTHGIIHGDLKPDNCLVRLDDVGSSDNEATTWSAQYSALGHDGWAAKGITLIDFGRSIDMTPFPTSVQFIADWKTSPTDCAEMRELRPWTYQVDYHGLASILHVLLFGKYIDTVAATTEPGLNGSKKYRLKESLKRYWQTDIWAPAFDMLLNSGRWAVENEETGRMPCISGLVETRLGMERWLIENAERRGLKAGLRRLAERVRTKK